MSNLLTNEFKVARRLKLEKEQIVQAFRQKFLGGAKDANALDAVKNLFLASADVRVTTQTYPDNSAYEGNLHIDGSRSGKGVMYLSNGDIYAGDWQSGKFNGQGTYIFANGER